MSKKLMMMVALLLAGGVSSYGAVVAAWDFGTNAPASSGWAEFTLGDNNSSTVAGLTLTQAASGGFSLRAQTPEATQTNALVLLAAGADEMDDGFDLTVGTPSIQAFTLSGLTEGQQYRLQFIGSVKSNSDAQNRNLTLTLDDAGSSTANLLVTTTLKTGINAGYSQYVTFTATTGDTEVVLTFGEVSSGVKCVSGLIVDAVVSDSYPLTVKGGSGSGWYTNGAQVAIAANAPPVGKVFSTWAGDTQVVASVTSATTTVTMPAHAVTLTSKYITQALDGSVIAAWDFGSTRDGAVPAGWTTWSNEDLISNNVPSTIGGLTLAYSSTNVVAPFASINAQQIDNLGVWGYVNAPMLALDTNSTAQNVYEDFLNSMTSAKSTKLTLSGLAAGQQYQIQFVSIFTPYEAAQQQLVTQDGVAATAISSVGVGATNGYRVIYSDYYNFTATATNAVQFGIDGSSTGNAGKNGLAGMIVKQVGLLTTTNGTPYPWLDQYGLTDYEADDVLDQDADGLLTWQEYIAGTVPTNKASSFIVTQSPADVLNWTAVPGRVYSVYWSTDLKYVGFTSLANNIMPPQNSYTNTTPGSTVNFYRMRVRLQ